MDLKCGYCVYKLCLLDIAESSTRNHKVYRSLYLLNYVFMFYRRTKVEEIISRLRPAPVSDQEPVCNMY
jgi:hypothetical protein